MIQKFVADYYQLKMVDLRSRNNAKSVAMPRQVAMYLCKSLTNASLAGDRQELWRQASLDGDPLDPQGRAVAPERSGVQHARQQPVGVDPLLIQRAYGTAPSFPQRRACGWIVEGRIRGGFPTAVGGIASAGSPQKHPQFKLLKIKVLKAIVSVTNSPLFLLYFFVFSDLCRYTDRSRARARFASERSPSPWNSWSARTIC